MTLGFRVGPRHARLAGIAALSLLVGCGGDQYKVVGSGGGGSTPVTGTAFSGVVQGNGQPVAGATVQLYAAGLGGKATGATALLSGPVTTNAAGAFQIPSTYSCPSPQAELYLLARGGAVSGAATTTSNPALAELVAVGPCSGVQAAVRLVLNEATTVAAAWALAQFVSPTGEIGASSTNATGLANAFLTAQALANVTTGTVPGAGFGANAVVPAASVNTLANLLSLCAADGGSAGCAAVLSGAATDGTTPSDTLALAVTLAQAPATGVASLAQLAATGTVYQPALTSAPPDWTLPVTYTGGGLIAPVDQGADGPTALAIDAGGQVWVANHGGVLSAFSPLGVPLFPQGITGSGLSGSYGLAIDPGGDVWVTNSDSDGRVNSGLGSVSVFNAQGQPISGSSGFTSGGLNKPAGLAIAPDGTVWITDNGNAHVTVLNGSGVPLSGTAGYAPPQLAFPNAVAIDSSGGAWVGNSTGSFITHLSAGGGTLSSVACCDGPAGLATDAEGAVWVTSFYGSTVSRVLLNGGVQGPFAAASLTQPQGIAIDGAGRAWVANFGGTSLTQLAGANDPTPGAVLSPAAGWAPGAGFDEAFGVAIDASGNVWVASFAGGSVTELIGAASPVRTPLLGPVTQP